MTGGKTLELKELEKIKRNLMQIIENADTPACDRVKAASVLMEVDKRISEKCWLMA